MSISFPWPYRSCLSGYPGHLKCSRRTFYSSSSRLQTTNDIKGKDSPLPPLNRPLGVRQRPTILAKTTEQKLKDLMDQDARMAQRRHLYGHTLAYDHNVTNWLFTRIKEAGKGYFHDLNMTRRHGGKTWIAPHVLIREDVRSSAIPLLRVDLIPWLRKHFTFPIYPGKA